MRTCATAAAYALYSAGVGGAPQRRIMCRTSRASTPRRCRPHTTSTRRNTWRARCKTNDKKHQRRGVSDMYKPHVQQSFHDEMYKHTQDTHLLVGGGALCDSKQERVPQRHKHEKQTALGRAHARARVPKRFRHRQLSGRGRRGSCGSTEVRSAVTRCRGRWKY